MRLDGIGSPQVNISSANVSRPGTASEKAPEQLAEGDVIRARVLSTGEGTASLRASDGTLLQAKLETGVHLSSGSDVFLTVQDRGSEVIVLSQTNSGVNASASSQQQTANPVINAIVDQLVSLGYEPTAENVSAMHQMITEFPNMTMQEAAFFAAQKIEPEPAILDAFRSMTLGETDTSTLLDNLAAVTSTLAEATAQAPVPVSASNAAPLSSPVPAVIPGEITESIPILTTDVLPHTTPESPVPVSIDISSVPVALENAPAASNNDAAVSTTFSSLEPVSTGLNQDSVINNSAPETVQNAQVTHEQQPASVTVGKPLTQNSSDLPDFSRWLLDALGTETSKQASNSHHSAFLTGDTLSTSPLLKGLSERSLSGIADSLNRIADSIPKSSSENELFENISKFAKELFVRLGESDSAKLHEQLKEVREDLYIKLAYFKDAVAASSASAKDVVLEQTQKLMDHLKLLNGLDQFVCVQIPVQLGDQNRNADLYIYKREKNGKARIDPENVKILLALDLTHMGKLETLIEIQNRDVSLRFEVENSDVVNTLKQNTTRIHKLLDSAGYKYANSTFVTKKSDTTIETALLSLLEIERSRSGMNILI